VRTCSEHDVEIQLYVDGELKGDECEDFLSHVANCAQCSQSVREAKAFSLQIRAARPLVAAPETLRMTVVRVMQDTKRTPSEPHVIPHQTSPSRRVWFLAAVTVVLGLVVGGTLVYQRDPQNNAGSMVKAAVFVHQRIEQHILPLDISTDSSETLTAWFQSRVSFPFHMADSGIASDVTAKYKLIGGRLLIINNEPVALVAFSASNTLVTMLVGPERLMTASGGTVVQSNGIALHSHDESPLHIVTWNHRGLIYVLTFTRPGATPHPCSSCHGER
jgi:anti-sigma factor RsiW